MTHRRNVESSTVESSVLRPWNRAGLVVVLALSAVFAAVGTAGQRAGDGTSGTTANDCGWAAGFHVAGLSDGVSALVVFDDGSGPALYAGGGFISAGEKMVHSIAKWDGSAWHPLSGPSGTGMTGYEPTVNALTVFDDGTGPALYAGGRFVTAGGVQANNIAKWDGTRWSALPGLLGSTIHTLAVYDDGTGPALYAGGLFTEADPGDVTVNRIARWDGSGWHPLSGPSGTGVEGNYPHVAALAVYDDGTGPALYLGGRFDTAGGVTANHLAKWDGEEFSALEGPTGIGIDERVDTLAVFDDGTGPALFVGGDFDTAGGVTTNNIARWDGSAFDALDGPSDTGTNRPVNAFSVYDDGTGPALYIGGEQTAAGGVHVGAIAKWDGETFSAVTGLSGQRLEGIVSALAVYDDGIGPELVAGGWPGVPDVADTANITKWNGSEFSALAGPPGNGFDGFVRTFAEYDDGSGLALYVGGGFKTAGGVSANRIARWNGSESSALVDTSDNGTSDTVYAIDVYDHGTGPALYIGGNFLTAGGITVNGLAQWDGTGFSGLGDTASPGAPGGAVRALEVFDDGTGPAIFVGGHFDSIGGLEPANNIARYDGSTFSVVGSGTSSEVYALAVFDDGTGPALYLGGGFGTAGGVEVDGIAKWDGAGFSAVHGSSGMGIVGVVLDLAVFDDGTGPALYVGGHLGLAGGVGMDDGIVKWDGRDFTVLQSADDSSMGGVVAPSVEALAVYDDGTGPALFIGGTFEITGGVTANNIVKWNGEAFSAVDGPLGAGPNLRVTALTSFDDGSGPALFAGGFFTVAGGFPTNHIASWQCEPRNPLYLQPRTPSGRVAP